MDVGRLETLRGIADEWRLALSEAELEEYVSLDTWLSEGLGALESSEPPTGSIREPRVVAARRPTVHEDPLNALIHVCDVGGDRHGPLSGMRIAVKDSIAVAGIPMTAGSRILESFVPSRDSIVARRLLHAGARIVATANMDEFGFSGGGDTSAFGPIRNPFDATRTAGGSSGGSAAALAYPGITATLGCDQAGSIRVPAAWCGVLGLKPTHGRVPYDGVLGIDSSLDHVGVLSRDTATMRRVLEAIQNEPTAAPTRVRRRAIGLVSPALAIASEPVAAATEGTMERLAALGFAVRKTPLLEQDLASSIAAGQYLEPMSALLEAGGQVYGGAVVWPELSAALRDGLLDRAGELSPPVKVALLSGTRRRRTSRGYHYAQAQALRPRLTAAVDSALEAFDALAVPTVPDVAPLLEPVLSPSERVRRGWSMYGNTSIANMTGHPALTMPAGEATGLPVGLMLIARHDEDHVLLEIAAEYEAAFGWSPESHRAGPLHTRPM